MEQNYSNSKPKPNKLKQAGIGLLGLVAGAYITGTAIETKRLSQELEPMRERLEEIAQTQTPNIQSEFNETNGRWNVTFDYGGKVDSINEAVQQFAKDNGAYSKKWGIIGETKTPSKPIPLALNPKYWGDTINTQALKQYK